MKKPKAYTPQEIDDALLNFWVACVTERGYSAAKADTLVKQLYARMSAGNITSFIEDAIESDELKKVQEDLGKIDPEPPPVNDFNPAHARAIEQIVKDWAVKIK